MSLIPVTLLTGFLGSGKTTLLNRLLRDPALKNALVLINEFGEIGLDHHLIEKIEESDGQQRILMASGCLCCTIQSDLSKTLRQMAIDRVRGTVTEFERVVIETTGLADPAPILHTLMQDPLVAAHYRLDGVVTTVDAVVGDATLTAQPEAVKQAAVADRIILTKQDIADPAKVVALKARLHALNPAAPILDTDAPAPALIEAGLWNPDTKSLDVRRWLQADTYEAHGHHHHDHDHGLHHHDPHHHHTLNRHDDRIEAHCLTLTEPLPWDAVTLWLQSLTAYRGEDILRLKAILNLRGQDTPTVLHGVQHLLHPPVKLPAWPDDDHRSRIVLITRDISRDLLEKSLKQLTEVVG
ncbi:ATP-binding protein [Elstera litoralis]|uniref:ATP-binding protein n=1 Tax=Elstera litoralis TaxID=552518 RepID=A0A0F3ITZ1_9PROT|nr:GTP-binding protein [Elstera litoralis]KJV10038.1 ATP-binding protein [Elstera litoralis]